jgi:membrane protease subunit HflC
MKRTTWILIIAALLVVVWGSGLIVFQVRTTEVALVTTFGKPTRDITAPGAYVAWPPPIQRIYKFDKRVQTYEDKFSQDLTADQFPLLTSVYIGWRITDPKAFFPKFPGGSVQEAEKVLDGLVRSAKTARVGRHPLADFVSLGGGTNFVAIENEILQSLQSQVESNNYGITIDFLGFKKIGFPDAVTQDVFNRMTSERQVLISKLQHEGEAEASKIRSDADRRAAEVLTAARGQATQIRGLGEAEAAKYLHVFEENPQLANFLFSLDALQNSLKANTTLIFDQQTPPYNLFRGVPNTSGPAR